MQTEIKGKTKAQYLVPGRVLAQTNNPAFTFWVSGMPENKHERKASDLVEARNFGVNLGRLIKMLGMSQTKLAERVGVPPSHISRIISGRAPNMRTIVKILQAVPATFEVMISEPKRLNVRPTHNLVHGSRQPCVHVHDMPARPTSNIQFYKECKGNG